MLHHIKDNIIPLFEDKETAKGLMEALEAKYGPKSETHNYSQINLIVHV